jgi:DNA-binding transcriptional ArsR family regulator
MPMAVAANVDVPAVLKVLAEPMRWEIVRRLAVEDLCTCHLVDDLGVSQPLVSHHLRALRAAGVVRAEPCGAFTYYLLDRDALAAAGAAIRAMAPRGRQRRRPCT